MKKIIIINSCHQCNYASEGVRHCTYHPFLKDRFACGFGEIPKRCPLPDASQPVGEAIAEKSCKYDHSLLKSRGAKYCEDCLQDLRTEADGRKLSEHCQDCKEEFGHPDNCIGCDHAPMA